jgi:YidC/Oxa1 family membrane protein insertase
VYRVTHIHGISLLGVSIVVSIFTLPLYFAAEKYQEKDRNLQNHLRPKINKIKSVFKGDEQYLVLSTFYRQNHYHPLYALKNSFSLLIQIPFFIAAYSYLSHLELLDGVSFLFINDLSKSDHILSIGLYRFNFLPVFMTAINVLSCAIYSKNLDFKDKVQLYGISIVFFVLLYNSPSGLVLYWTMNNIFSLFKNILQKNEYKKTIIYILVFLFVLLLDIYLIFIKKGLFTKRLLVILLFSSILIIPFIKKIFNKLTIFKPQINNNININFFNYFPIFLFSCIILFLLHAFVIPSSLIASSVEEFSYIGSRTTPFPFIFNTLKQGIGIFIFWPLLIYFLFSKKIRHIMTFIFVVLSIIAIINAFLVNENNGFLTITMEFSNPKNFMLIPGTYILNIFILSIAFIIISMLFHFNKLKLVFQFQIISLVAILGYGITNIKKIHDDFIFLTNKMQNFENENDLESFIPQYTFSKTGKNILLIMLDRVTGDYVPFIFNEKPELYSIMTGFNWYPNCVSFSNHTLVGATPIYGGYDYSPLSINNRDKVPLFDKQKEAYLLLPVIFNNAGYSIRVTDPPFDNFKLSNLEMFIDYPEFNAENISGKYTYQWYRNNSNINIFNINDYLDNNLIRFSFFKTSPLFFRFFIYDRGIWLRFDENKYQQITDVVIRDYSFLDILDKITNTTETGDTYTALYSLLTHSNAFLQAPDYILSQPVINSGTSPLSNASSFHTAMAAFILLGKWFEYLKSIGVYDNTRIILVSDHGLQGLHALENFSGNIALPNGDRLSFYNALLMMKDFNATGELKKSDEFMTNADTPLLILKDIVDNPVNPFTDKPLLADKNHGIFITTINNTSSYTHTKYAYNIKKNQWLYVKDNIFEPTNWKNIEP